MLIKSDFDHVRSGIADEHRTLFVAGKLQQFLTEIISERI